MSRDSLLSRQTLQKEVKPEELNKKKTGGQRDGDNPALGTLFFLGSNVVVCIGFALGKYAYSINPSLTTV